MARFHSLCALIVTSPAPPGPSPDPRPQPPASEELWPNFSQPPLLFGASESFSPRTFSFDLGRKGFLLIERWGSCFSARLGTPLLSAAALSYLSGSRRAEVCCARCPRLSSSLFAPSLAWCRSTGTPDPSLPEIRRAARKRGAHDRAVPGAERNEWNRTEEPGSWPRPLGVALRTRKRGAAGQRRQPGAKVSWD